MNVLTAEDKQKILKEWLKTPEDKRSKAEFARRFNVSPRTIGRIIDGDERKKDVAEKPVATKKAAKVEQVETKQSEPDLTVVRWFGSKGAITMTLSNGDNISINSQNENYKTVLDALMNEDFSTAIRLSSIKRMFEYCFGHVKVTSDGLTYKGNSLDLGIAKFLVERLNAADTDVVERLVKFLNNLMENPSYKSVQQLYPFLKHNDIQIDDDGYIIAWKVVNADYTDCHTGTIDNSVGKVVEMERNQVEDDPNKTCSAGLHVCAKRYINTFGSKDRRVLKVRINPKDVVSVPTDYNGSKKRVCRYEVLADVTDSKEWK